MKKISLLLLTLTICFFTACHDDIWNAIDDLDGRVTKLEELCKEMNINITSLQTIVSVLQSNDYITGIVEIKKNGEVIGYTITFGKHDPITIYHGQDGKDGADGKDGQDSSANAPVIGVAQDIDGMYYWTLNGEWLLDNNGNKLPVSGKDGQNGANGTMPQLKIEEGYWYVSYDNGMTWAQLGKATGEDGKKGDKGDTGDSMFHSVTQDDNYVYFTLADGTVIKIAKGNGDNAEEIVQIIDGAIMAKFSVSETKKVYFSMGNLQYNSEGTHKCADGTIKSGTWRFAEKQYELKHRRLYYPKIEGNIQIEKDLFEWGSSGYNDNFNSYNNDITNTYYDWGKYNAIKNGGNIPNQWRTLTKDEYYYLLEQRPNAKQLNKIVVVNDTTIGLLLLPDTWKYNGILPTYMYTGEQFFESYPSIEKLFEKGAVYIPVTQVSDGPNNAYPDYFPNIDGFPPLNGACQIASSTLTTTDFSQIYAVQVISSDISIYKAWYSPQDLSVWSMNNAPRIQTQQTCPLHVRLVKDVE